MEVDGQLHAPVSLLRIKIFLFTLASRLGGPQNRFEPCQDSICDCWIGDRRRLYFLVAFCQYTLWKTVGKGKYSILFQ